MRLHSTRDLIALWTKVMVGWREVGQGKREKERLTCHSDFIIFLASLGDVLGQTELKAKK